GNNTGTYNAGGTNAFTLTVNVSTGEVTLDQIRALTHPTGGTGSPDELVTLATGAVTLIATVTDRDGDIASANIDLGGRVSFHDD
ncbi:DUF5801 repeats-in-toxin domain-containing protein, partial [Flavonifractor plautii]|uniref:DUF5801 repeats-in-toxin domain-containing protein n=1 Tax=Flavonifractor plautii TaxID=292800 RepID=UPI003D7E952B